MASGGRQPLPPLPPAAVADPDGSDGHILRGRSVAARTESCAHALQAESKMGKDLSTGNLKSHLQHNHRVEFQVCCVCVRASLFSAFAQKARSGTSFRDRHSLTLDLAHLESD